MLPAQIDDAIETRMSVRAFTPKVVPRDTVASLLQDAAMGCAAPAESNWRVHVLQGPSRDSLCKKVCAVHDALCADPNLRAGYREQYDYYPATWASPYLERRRENGWSLYGLLGIGRDDKHRMHVQHQRNYQFFDAPVNSFHTPRLPVAGFSHWLD